MSMHEVAQHLSAMGRNGDSVLVHMSPAEVKVMNGIASIGGNGMTVNPDTGLPEAFNLGGFFRSLLPTIVGAAAGPFGPLASVAAGAATGAALNRDNPLMGAFTGGLGGYGGMGIGKAFNAASSAPAAAQQLGNATNAESAAESAISATPTITPAIADAGNVIGNTTSYGIGDGLTAAQQAAGQDAAARSLMAAVNQTPASTGISALGTKEGLNAYTQALGGTGPNASLIAAGKTISPLGMAALSGIEPPKAPGEEKYDPYATLNLGKDTGLRLLATGGDVNFTPQESQDDRVATMGHSPYGLTSLRSSGGLGYARGGYLDGPGDGMSDSIKATIEGKQPARLADGEFVIPADVVSHLGNGSTKAGAERLYEMLDKVRKARTGHTKQGKQINPKKFLPA